MDHIGYEGRMVIGIFTAPRRVFFNGHGQMFPEEAVLFLGKR